VMGLEKSCKGDKGYVYERESVSVPGDQLRAGNVRMTSHKPLLCVFPPVRFTTV
jgi:hypothetical protein